MSPRKSTSSRKFPLPNMMSMQNAGSWQGTAPLWPRPLVPESPTQQEQTTEWSWATMENQIPGPTASAYTATGSQTVFWSACFRRIIWAAKYTGLWRPRLWRTAKSFCKLVWLLEALLLLLSRRYWRIRKLRLMTRVRRKWRRQSNQGNYCRFPSIWSKYLSSCQRAIINRVQGTLGLALWNRYRRRRCSNTRSKMRSSTLKQGRRP